MDTFQIASLAIAFVNAAAAGIAAAGIWFGIRAMVRSNDRRGDQQDKAMAQQREFMAQQREAEDRRHKEATEQQREAMAQHDRRHEEAMAALKELIRRTAAPGSGTGE